MGVLDWLFGKKTERATLVRREAQTSPPSNQVQAQPRLLALDYTQVWEKQENVEKLFGALRHERSEVRQAAAEALSECSANSKNASLILRDQGAQILVRLLGDPDVNMVAAAARALRTFDFDDYLVSSSAEPYINHPFKPVVSTSLNAPVPAVQKIIAENLLSEMLSVKAFEAQCARAAYVTQALKDAPHVSEEVVTLLLDQVATVFIDCEVEEESELGDALIDFGRKGAEQLVRKAESYPEHARTAALRTFAERILDGEACGTKHDIAQDCVCVRCDKKAHALGADCKCAICGKEMHGCYSGPEGPARICRRCGAEVLPGGVAPQKRGTVRYF